MVSYYNILLLIEHATKRAESNMTDLAILALMLKPHT